MHIKYYPGIEQAARDVLAEYGWIVIEGLPLHPRNLSLLSLAKELGRVQRRDNSANDPTLEDEAVHIVRVWPTPHRNRFGTPIKSTSASAFPLHTDEAFLPLPCQYVCLHCWVPDPSGGGVSLLSDLAGIISLARDRELFDWTLTQFEWRFGSSPILSRRDDGRYIVRFNREALAPGRIGQSNIQHPLLMPVFKHFSLKARALSFRVILRSGDCLVLDNHRMLHGRTEFRDSSPRLLKRVRILDYTTPCNVNKSII